MKIVKRVWNFLVAWGESMEAYRKTHHRGSNFNRYI